MMFLSSFGLLPRASQRPRVRLCVEPLEARDCPSGSHLLIGSYDTDQILRYDGHTGAFVDVFVGRRSGGLNQPWSLVYSPHDGNLLVGTGHFQGPGQLKAVLRFDGTTGAFLNEFVERGQMNMVHVAMFGPDGHLYVGVRDAPGRGRIARFDGVTGAYLDDFVPPGSGG